MPKPRWTAAAGFVLLATSALAAEPPTSPPMTPQPAAPVLQEKLPPAPEEARRINAADARQALAKNEAVIVDVRDKGSYDAEHAQGAILIPLMEIPSRAAELPKDKLVITYCT